MKVFRSAIYWSARFLWWFDDCPKGMLRSGRLPDPEFDVEELLYLRCRREWVEGGTVLPAYVHFPDQSVNRSKYSRSWHVLVPDGSDGSAEWIFWGIARTSVSAIPAPMTSSGGVTCAFTVEHDPLERNFGHSELRVYKNGVREPNKKKINERIKKAYRQILSEQTRVILRPDV